MDRLSPEEFEGACTAAPSYTVRLEHAVVELARHLVELPKPCACNPVSASFTIHQHGCPVPWASHLLKAADSDWWSAHVLKAVSDG